MRVLLQRVTRACVRVDGAVVGEIESGLLLLVGITHGDTTSDADWMAAKISTLRVFAAVDGPSGFDRSVLDTAGGVLAVSQFTLYGEARKGRRPDFVDAARPEHARPLFDYFVGRLRASGIARVATGVFGADMAVELVNHGPVTLFLESPSSAEPKESGAAAGRR
jgi:D-tyrosyl-tRNA(Tyr) deacylase